ncbi:class I SAM-dependent methyltransferase [Sporolactobacillus sp. CPB3-1]|uniref:Class I SAM-dependent methyltransferase n=1 Tax=Sporolactobacillus mangiferae TaxID=2940498 RepID=A0ABT0MBG6_9BACL|nr:class I SAM-dependent methyltransferase [Sporolactobacillus mangiferae]MCL1632018.1 class I SAM-dependent methyltransferase [Sporolactobacillus mangiferae]
MNRIEVIRKSEKDYHDYCYDHNKLFEKGSWLYMPVSTVMEQLKVLKNKDFVRVLDLGSGVGRNSIPIAQKIRDGEVVCVDLLDSAINHLRRYSQSYGVKEKIKPIQSDLVDFPIEPNGYDYIIAVSSLEHVATIDDFRYVLQQIVKGTKHNGINCLIINSNMEERLVETNQPLDVTMELNLPTCKLLEELNQVYSQGWKMIDSHSKLLDFTISRAGQPVRLTTTAVTYVAQLI